MSGNGKDSSTEELRKHLEQMRLQRRNSQGRSRRQKTPSPTPKTPKKVIPERSISGYRSPSGSLNIAMTTHQHVDEVAKGSFQDFIMTFQTEKKDHVAHVRKLFELGFRYETISGVEVVLGKGSYGKVFMARRRFGEGKGTPVGIKMMDMAYKKGVLMDASARDSYRQNVEREIRTHSALSNLNNPNLIKQLAHYMIDHKVYIVLEYCNSQTVKSYIYDIPPAGYNMTEDQIRYWFRQMVNGLGAMHSANIAHRDLKPENILVHRPTNRSVLKICDFGFSIQDSGQEEKLCGTPLYMSPQILMGRMEQKYGPIEPLNWKAADVWALGVTLYELFYRSRPFQVQLDSKKAIQKIIETAIEMGHMSQEEAEVPDAWKLVCGLLNPDPAMRLTVDQIPIVNPWLLLPAIDDPTLYYRSTKFPQK